MNRDRPLEPKSTPFGFARALRLVVFTVVVLVAAVPVRAAIIPLPNSGDDSLSGSLGISGASAAIGGKVFFESEPLFSWNYPLQTVPVSFGTSLALSSQPDPSSAFVAELGGPFDISLVSFTNFDIDLLPSKQIELNVTPVEVDAVFNATFPYDDTLQISGSLVGMSFTQTAAPTIFPLPGEGNRDFTVPGILSLNLDEFLFQVGVISFNIGPTTAVAPTTLAGTFSVFGPLVQVSGTGSADIPYSISETIPVGEPASHFTASIQGTVQVQFDYSFTLFNEIPEPSSVVLLGIGLTSLAIVAVRRRR